MLKDYRRVLVYVGFPDMPKGFDELLFAELDRIGAISAYREDAELSRAAVVDLGASGPDAPAFVEREARPTIGGCVGIRSAVRPVSPAASCSGRLSAGAGTRSHAA